MSFYNLIHGVNPATLFILPMLGKHPDEYPRFRDCFLGDKAHPEHDSKIIVYTRTGGGNRKDYEAENDAIRAMEGFITDYDDEFDSTFACWVFRIPDRWGKDFYEITARQFPKVSAEYVAEMKRVYPKLADKIDEVFAAKPTEP